MADAYGSILMTIPEGADVDHQGLVDALNQYQDWSSEGGSWKVIASSDKNIIIYDAEGNYQVQYPSVQLTRVTHLNVADGHDFKVTRKVPADQATDEDWESVIDEDSELVSLKEISKQFAPFIKSGWIEISCCSHEKMRSADFQRLRVAASGDVRREIMHSNMFGDSSFDILES